MQKEPSGNLFGRLLFLFSLFKLPLFFPAPVHPFLGFQPEDLCFLFFPSLIRSNSFNLFSFFSLIILKGRIFNSVLTKWKLNTFFKIILSTNCHLFLFVSEQFLFPMLLHAFFWLFIFLLEPVLQGEHVRGPCSCSKIMYVDDTKLWNNLQAQTSMMLHEDTDLINGGSDWIWSLCLRVFQKDFTVQNFERSQILWFYFLGARTWRSSRAPWMRTWCPAFNKVMLSRH